MVDGIPPPPNPFWDFQARSYSREKRLVSFAMSIFLSVRQYTRISAARTGRVSAICDALCAFMKICRGNPNLLKIGQQCLALQIQTSALIFIVVGGIHSAIKAFLCSTQYFCIVDSDRWLNNAQRNIVERRLQKWLRESARILKLFVCCFVLQVLKPNGKM